MSSQTDAVSRHAPARPLDRQRLAWLPCLAIVAVFGLAILMRQWVPLNPDVSWLLIVAGRMLDGQQLYRDIVEINPPMAGFAYMPGVALARLLGVDARHVVDGQLLVLAAASLWVSSRILRKLPALAQRNGWPLAIWAAAVMTVLPMNVFAQREHIAALTFLPALAVYALRAERVPVPVWAVVIAGGGAGITMAFKPFFAVPAALCIVASAIRSRSWPALFAPENFIAGALVGGISIGTYVLYPEYFSVTYPLVRDIYLSNALPFSAVVFNPATLIFAVALVTVLLARTSGALDSLSLTAVLAAAGFAVSFYLQRRGWAYHSYPMVAVALLAMGYALLLPNDAAPARRFGLAAPVILLATFLFGVQWFNGNVHVGPLREALADLKPHPRLLVLSGEAAVGHPLVHDIHGTWVLREQHLWIREFVRLTREATHVDAATDARLENYLAQERRWLIEDFRKSSPDIVLIDNLRDGFGDWARADAELAQLLKPYVPVRTVEGIEILRRRD